VKRDELALQDSERPDFNQTDPRTAFSQSQYLPALLSDFFMRISLSQVNLQMGRLLSANVSIFLAFHAQRNATGKQM
jgi:hypothetical protein